MKEKKSSLILIGISIAGLFNALYTLWHRQRLFSEGVAEKSFCNISERVNCDAAALSQYSSILGIPTSAWGTLFYLFILAFSLRLFFAFTDNQKEIANQSATWIKALSLLGIFPTVYLAYVSFFILHNICMFCTLSYLINISLLCVSQIGLKSAPKNFSLKFSTSFISTLVVMTLFSFFMPTIMSHSLNSNPLSEKEISLYWESHATSKEQSLKSDNLPFIGDPAAKITLVEYSDFQCPFCGRSAKTLPLLMKNYPIGVKLVYKNFPLDSSCNPSVKSTMHPFACYAAKTSLCVYKKLGNAAFIRFKDKVFEKQSTISKASIDDAAKAESLIDPDLTQCRDSLETHQALLDQIEEAIAIGVDSTPSLYINGRQFRGAHMPPLFNDAIKKYLANQSH